ncbi:hypothetical protein [Embleya sp. AB8]|uniref:hypothetical protein n=1 Tax=Embleya sp. AB8 TaxID=3156304 RepID=UPI003C77152B
MRSLRISAAALTVPLALLVAGCGQGSGDPLKTVAANGGDALDPKGPSNEGLSVDELAKKAQAAFKDLANLRVEGTGKAYDTPLGVDLKIGTGEQVEGNLTLADKRVDVIGVDKTAYVRIAPGTIQALIDLGKKAEAASGSGSDSAATESPEDKALGDRFTKMFTEAAKLVEGKYLKFGGSDAGKLGKDFFKGGSAPKLDGLFGPGAGTGLPFGSGDPSDDSPDPTDSAKPKPKPTKGAVTEINGTKVIPLITKDEDGTTTTIYVAANGKPFPIRVTADDKSDGTNEFTLDLKYSKLQGTISPKAPAAADTIDLNAILKSFGTGSGLESLFGEDPTKTA